MSAFEKLLYRFLLIPKDFTYKELTRLLKHFGYRVYAKGKTSGSRIVFINNENHIIRLHKPHPGNELKGYQLKYVLEELRKKGYVK